MTTQVLENGQVQNPTRQGGDAIALFLANLNSSGTRTIYSREVRLFLDFIRKPLELISIEDMLRYKESLVGLKPATISRKLRIVKGLFRSAYEQRFIASDPAHLLKVPRVYQKELDILTLDEAKALLNAPNRKKAHGLRDYAVLTLMFSTGIRKSELCGLDIGDLSTKLSHKTLTIRSGKGGKPRSIGLPDGVWETICDYLKTRGVTKSDDPLFLTLGKRGMKPQRITPVAIDHLVSANAKAAQIGKKVHPHLLRHCACSYALANGADPKSVQTMAGHSCLSLTSRYIHLLDAVATSAANHNPLFNRK